MIPHPTDSELDAFARHTCAPAALIEIDRHLAGCDDCRSRLQRLTASSLKSLHREISSALPEDHLSYESVETLALGGSLPDAAHHVETCAQCREEVDDLRRFHASFERPEVTVPKPARIRFYRAWMGAAAAIVIVALTPLIWKRSHPVAVPQIANGLHDAGGTVGFDQNGNLSNPRALPSEYSRVIADAIRTGQLEVGGIAAGLGRSREVLLGAPQGENSFALHHPIAESVVADRPVFSWDPLAGASSYRVSIYDEDFQMVAASPELAVTQWTPPESLPRTHVYSWTVTAHAGDRQVREPVPPAPEAKFVVLALDEAAHLREAQREYPDEHLLLAALFAHAGALEEAQTELQKLASANPGSDLVQHFKSSLDATP